MAADFPLFSSILFFSFAIMFAAIPFTIDARWRREMRMMLRLIGGRQQIVESTAAYLRSTIGKRMVFGIEEETQVYFADLRRLWG